LADQHDEALSFAMSDLLKASQHHSWRPSR
jgi:hypothetical protein